MDWCTCLRERLAAKGIRLTTVLFALLLFAGEINGQIIGEIFSRSEGEAKFGAVTMRATMESRILLNEAKSRPYLMFGIAGGVVVVADKERKIVYPEGFELQNEKVMMIYSRERIEELLLRGGEEIVYAEQREKAFTLRCGEFILEVGTPCPPYCLE
ncbi:MAG: hypothetical protein HRU80_03810 [Ignavibacteriales bacterium]|nr:MAG: hypothetical protein HRU80_03810 [Ignavibacteriales bacterium]